MCNNCNVSWAEWQVALVQTTSLSNRYYYPTLAIAAKNNRLSSPEMKFFIDCNCIATGIFTKVMANHAADPKWTSNGLWTSNTEPVTLNLSTSFSIAARDWFIWLPNNFAVLESCQKNFTLFKKRFLKLIFVFHSNNSP